MAAARGRVEPAPRRVRGYLGDRLVFDTTTARYVWEVPYYPQYYIPLADVRTDDLVDVAARVFDDGDLAGLVRFEFDALTWFEEDERIHVHPRNPYARVDALRSHRHVVVELDGVVLADTRSPVLLFETGLPTRYYIDRTDVRFEHLEPSDTVSQCPYKGVTSAYWSVRSGESLLADLAWSYDYPLPAVASIAGTVAFYNEKVDISVDGQRLVRPSTHFG
ncbi:DUF427 domain-containing protein [Mycolicibacterium arenosum]|uniref:DUF427 domain-containing protein n=1 Tax=Mycolicibacterium arenosum TaxID=2952157 RepID=A0ABT1LUQ9_9MYCO|nr:DUF427 domain-containing protein [Mycolicibacterium sp. CAU 1645]MCP9270641.1 DUF427 domain-containing protein [Mycolicibacterium sp. CAU 1645]